MIQRFLADAVLVFHFAFVLFVVLGGFLAWRWPRLAWVHLPVAAWGAAIEFGGWICPLTPLEKWLRELSGEGAYAGGFIEHYVTRIIYPDGLSRGVKIAIGAGVVAVNLAAYLVLWRRRSRRG